jgi:hypothetical protein
MKRLKIGEDGTVYLMNENDPPIEDDWGSAEQLTAAEVCGAHAGFSATTCSPTRL